MENDGGIVKATIIRGQSLSRLWRQLPLHKGATVTVNFREAEGAEEKPSPAGEGGSRRLTDEELVLP